MNEFGPNGGHNWRGGVSERQDGYRSVWMPDHPNAMAGGHVLEHVIVVSEALGKPVPEGAVIHHVNGDPSDNRPENLVLCEDQAYHNTLHRREKALRECGNANWFRCHMCKEYDSPENLRVPDHPLRSAYHRECDAKRAREYRARKRKENVA